MKTGTKRWKKMAGALGVLGFFLSSAAAIQVTPTYQIFQVKPGGSTTGELTLINNEADPMPLTPGVKDWYTFPANEKFPTDTWLIVDPESFVLQPGESRKVTFKIKTPKKAVGELMGMLTFSSKSQMLTSQLSVAMYVSLEGTEKIEAETAAISVQASTHTIVSVLINNTGNVHVRPRGLIRIFDKDDQLQINAVPEYGKPVFPGQPRALSATIRNFRLLPGRYRAVIELEDGDREYTFPVQEKKFTVGKDGRTKGQ